MAAIAFHFERLCCALEDAEAMEDREEAAEYLRAVALSLRKTQRNAQLRLWFLRAALEVLEVELEPDEIAV